MKRILFSFSLIFLLSPGTLFAQRDSLRNLFLDAESWFLFEEYADALPLYMQLLESDPGNDNLKYRIGVCLLNDPYQKDKAIEYLLDASDNINPDHKESSLKESTAPQDVLYYLGDAYLVNELLNKAIDAYQQFLEIMDREVYDEELVLAQITACENAKRLKTMPVDFDLLLLDSLINTRYSDIQPVISGDGTKLAFTTELPFYDGAFFCEKTDEGWSYPQSITQILGFDADVYPVGLSYDGTEMILYYDDQYIGNLYYSKYEEGRWQEASKLGENISTKYWESHGCFSKDGRTLYFTSNRKGTYGGVDIYTSERQPDGKWGVPENLGPTINSRYNEESPYIAEDGQTLYFSSYGHFNMGGYDIFFSRKDANGNWSEPINLGYPINTTDDDLFFQPVNRGMGAYYSLYSPNGRGRHDIYFMDIYSADNPRMYLVSGNFKTADGMIDSTQMAIFIVDANTGDTIIYTAPDQETGEFSFNLQQGFYDLHFVGEGYEELIRPLHITRHSNKEGIQLDDNIELALIKHEPIIFEGAESLIQLKDTLYKAKAGETVKVPLKLEKGNLLITKIYQDSVLVNIDTMEVEKRRTELEVSPLAGENRIELEMIDSEDNIHKQAFTVMGEEPVREIIEPELVDVGVPDGDLMEPAHPEEDPMGATLFNLKQNTTGPLGDLLGDLDPDKEGITTQLDLFGYLLEQAEAKGYSKEEVDRVLADVVSEGDVELLRQRLINHSQGSLKEYLEQLDPEAEGIETPGDLLKHLEQVADEQGFSMEEVREAMLQSLNQLEKEQIDKQLIDRIGEGDLKLYYQHLLENSEGTLKEYLEQLDLEATNIKTPYELLIHLEEVAEEKGFTMDEVREALLESLEKPLVVVSLFNELLKSTEGPVKEVLDAMDLQKEKIATVEELIRAIYDELEKQGYNRREIEKMLMEHFESHADFIKKLGKQRGKEGKGKGFPTLLYIGFGAGLILLILFWRRRSKNNPNTHE